MAYKESYNPVVSTTDLQLQQIVNFGCGAPSLATGRLGSKSETMCDISRLRPQKETHLVKPV